MTRIKRKADPSPPFPAETAESGFGLTPSIAVRRAEAMQERKAAPFADTPKRRRALGSPEGLAQRAALGKAEVRTTPAAFGIPASDAARGKSKAKERHYGSVARRREGQQRPIVSAAPFGFEPLARHAQHLLLGGVVEEDKPARDIDSDDDNIV